MKIGILSDSHDHIAHSEQVGECLLVNPGELMGLHGTSSYVVLDTENGKLEWVKKQY